MLANEIDKLFLGENSLAHRLIAAKKDPKLNHLAPPFAICPKTKIKPRIKTKKVYKAITRYEFFKNLISIKEDTKNKVTEILIKKSCLQNIELDPSKEDIVIKPKIIKIKKEKKIIQSPFLKKFIIFNLKFSTKLMIYFI